MAYSVTTKKTWSAILDDIEDSLARWRGVTLWRVDTILAPRSSTKQSQSQQERTITLHYTRKGRAYQIKMDRQRRAVDNLLVIWLILETLRLNEARGYAAEIAAVYRQEFPALPAPSAAPTPSSTGPYALLYVRNNAPIEVCEAAYRALTKLFHPDVTGSTAVQQSLNEAIEFVRKEKAK